METNELPEEVKKQIEAEALRLNPDVNIGYERTWWKSGALFGYRLALQSKEEELAKLKFNVEVGDARIQELPSENERLRELCLKLCSDVQARSVGVPRVTREIVHEIFSLLSQSTDKQDKP